MTILKLIFKKNLVVLAALALMVTSIIYLNNKQEIASAAAKHQDKYVYETFKITEIDKDKAVHGDLLESSAGNTGEGIYLENSANKEFNLKRNIKVGDVIIVTYNKKDYFNDVWDNIQDVKIMLNMQR